MVILYYTVILKLQLESYGNAILYDYINATNKDVVILYNTVILKLQM